MDLNHMNSTLAVIIKDPLSLFLNRKWVKFLGPILISLGKIIMHGQMEMGILLFSLSEMILILSNLNVWINKKKFIMV